MRSAAQMAKRKQTAVTAPPEAPALDPQLGRRVVVEGITPQVDGGQFPIKRTPGEDVIVEADVFADGHDALTAVVLWRPQGQDRWNETPMEALGNDRWRARFRITEMTAYEYAVEGWIDQFESWRLALSKKVGAGQDVSSELLEGAGLIRGAAARARGNDKKRLTEQAAALADTSTDAATRVAGALAEDLKTLMARYDDRSRATRSNRPFPVMVERERARFGAWYEMFPRSAGTDPSRGATLDEAAARFPYIAAMGFDVLYLPPVHPIGTSFRKGRNNSLMPEPGDPGSPWAIGAAEGGHKAIEPGLGTLEDFDRFVKAAERHGLEIALDIAFQASPDHPYVKEHPSWFRHRPDGTIKYAENPPKKYQDIYPFDFESEDWAGLWHELRSVIEFWAAHGVTIFRVDNPHTKPFRFWQWALAEIKRSTRTRSSCRKRSPGRRSCAISQSRGSRSPYTVLHLAQLERRADRILHRADPDRGRRVHATEPLREYARHPSRVSAARRSAGVSGAPRPGRDAGRQLRDLQRIRIVREHAGQARQ